jgi:hypothetical protein
MPARPWAYWIPLLLSTLLPDVLAAQTVSTHSTQYWLTAGAGVGHMASSDTWVGETGTATSLAAIVQHGTLVASLRGSERPWTPGMVGTLAPLSELALRPGTRSADPLPPGWASPAEPQTALT